MKRLYQCGRYFSKNMAQCALKGKNIYSPGTITSAHLMKYCSSAGSHHLNVKPFGKFTYKGDGFVKIQAVDPQKYSMNEAILSLQSLQNSSDELCVSEDLESVSVIQALSSGTRLNCDAELPIKYALDLHPGEGEDVVVSNMESESVSIESKKSLCFLRNLKAASIRLKCNAGKIVSESVLQGNIKIETTGLVPVRANKVQSTNLVINQVESKIKIEALYGKEVRIASREGDIELGNCHGDINIGLDEGTLSVGSLDGNLNVKMKKGNISVMISDHNNIDILLEDKGDVNISVADTTFTQFEIESPHININDDVTRLIEDETDSYLRGIIGRTSEPKNEFLQGTERNLNIKAPNGKVSVIVKDWMTSLKLR